MKVPYSTLKLFTSVFLVFFTATANAQYISVDTGYTPEELVEKFFGQATAGCLQFSNVTLSGKDFGSGNRSYGYFNRNGSGFEMDGGIILSTGNAVDAKGPNSFIQTEYRNDPYADSRWPGDQDLITILNQNGLNSDNILNATVLEFDFISNKSSSVSFEYMFLSEEYRQQNCKYSDAFAFLIKKAESSSTYHNIAVVPGTQTPVSTLTINTASGCPKNTAYFGSFNEVQTPTNFNGQTKILTAKADVEIGVKYHIKLVIADHGDPTGLFDSAVFLKAGSFVGSKDIGGDRTIAGQNALCEGASITLSAETNGATYQWYKDGADTGETSSTFTVTAPGLYEVHINDGGCILKGSALIEYTEQPVLQDHPISFCNYNDGQPIQIDLQQLNRDIVTNYQPYFRFEYHLGPDDTTPLPDSFSYTEDTTLYVKIISGTCAVTETEIHLKTPEKSLILQDKTICPGTLTTLDAGTGFSYYRWKNGDDEVIEEGENSHILDNVPVGNYSVELTAPNGCTLSQPVKVSAAVLPQITNIEVTGNTATVYVIGGASPYQYALDNGTYQPSNIFTSVPRGLHTIYLKDRNSCEIISKEFLVINLINMITPDSDGKNDIIDYSDLSIKKDVIISIYDRFGKMVHRSEKQNYRWNGTDNGKPLPTGTYWYILNWTEPDTDLPVTYKGWILLKNRN